MKTSKSFRGLVAGVCIAAFFLGGCGVAHHSVDKMGRVLKHGERKLERNL